MNSDDINRYIPSKIKRQLRCDAGFGCCVCGHPFYEYHHIYKFILGQHHDPKDMMILCPNHHHEATIGVLEEVDQRNSKSKPFNIQRGFVDGQLKINSKLIVIEAGSNLFIGEGFKLVVDNEALLRLEEDKNGRLLITIDLYDRNDKLLVSIVKNEWIAGDPLPWDFEFGYNWLKLRRKQRDIALFVDARKQPIDITGDFWRKGQNFSLKKDILLFNGLIQNIGLANIGLAGLMLIADTKKKKYSIAADPLLGKGKIFNPPNYSKRIEFGLKIYQELLNEIGS